MSKVLVTGGAGFIGSHISNTLSNQGCDVIVIDNMSAGSADDLAKEVKLYEMDITDNGIYEVFKNERPDYVIHEAAQIDIQRSMAAPVHDAGINALGTLNVLECCRRFGVKKIIHASTAAVYGHPEYLGLDEEHRIKPISFYGVSKSISEEYVRFYKEIYGLDYTILRYANVYGDRQGIMGEGGVISVFIRNMLSGKDPVIYGSGKQIRDFIYVKDVVRANICALDRGKNEVINIGTGIGTSIISLFGALINIIGDFKPVYEKNREGEITESYFNTEKSRRVLGWKAEYALAEGLKKTVDYHRDLIKGQNA